MNNWLKRSPGSPNVEAVPAMLPALEVAEKSDGYPYLTIGEELRLNAVRHWANAQRYISEGRPDYALGSQRKAYLNLARMEIFKRYGGL